MPDSSRDGVQDARDDVAEARTATEAAAARAREASEACSYAADARPEYMERLAQEEAAASSALAEAQDQVMQMFAIK